MRDSWEIGVGEEWETVVGEEWETQIRRWRSLRPESQRW